MPLSDDIEDARGRVAQLKQLVSVASDEAQDSLLAQLGAARTYLRELEAIQQDRTRRGSIAPRDRTAHLRTQTTEPWP